MRYVTISTIVEGALDREEEFFDYALAEEFLRSVAIQADYDGLETEVYILNHYHAPEEECECIQFETDHRPAYVFPRDEAPAEDEHPLA